jgi:uncharacterized membrane protein
MDWRMVSRLFFALTRLAMGLIGLNTLTGFIGGGSIPMLPPLPDTVPAHELLTYVSIAVSLVGGAGLLARRTGAAAALVLLAYFIAWAVLFKVPIIVRAPLEEVSYQNMGESLVLVAATWVLYRELSRSQNFLTGNPGLRVAQLIYGLALFAFGLSHFFYLSLTAPLIPGWLPGHVFWAYFTGSIYLATGIALAAGFYVRPAAAIVTAQIALITLLVWGPMVVAGHMTVFHWQETIVSCALTAGAWVVAASFGGRSAVAVSGSQPATAARLSPSR